MLRDWLIGIPCVGLAWLGILWSVEAIVTGAWHLPVGAWIAAGLFLLTWRIPMPWRPLVRALLHLPPH